VNCCYTYKNLWIADSDLDGAEDVELVWNDLIGYYRMSVVCGDLSAYRVSGRLRNINSSRQQTAPIPLYN
jgi:hypothetical protein